jgi:hypothetical protein
LGVEGNLHAAHRHSTIENRNESRVGVEQSAPIFLSIWTKSLSSSNPPTLGAQDF